MFNKLLLKSELTLKELNFSQLAKTLNISKSTLSKKINSKSEFTLAEIQKISLLIGFDKTMNIFFAK